MNIYYFRFEAIPTHNAGDFRECGGAMVNCWIKEDDKERASRKATLNITNNGWKIIRIEEAYLVEHGMNEGEESLKYFEQAKIDGEVYVYHTWPVEPQDDDQVH